MGICGQKEQEHKLLINTGEDVSLFQKNENVIASQSQAILTHDYKCDKDYQLDAQKLKNYKFGFVCPAIRRDTGIERFVKGIFIDPQDKVQMSRINKEISCFQSLDHPNIVKLLDVYMEEKKVLMAFEYCKGPTLFEGVHNCPSFGERDAARIMDQILRTDIITGIHSLMNHSHLNFDNFRYQTADSGSIVKLTDFGYSIIRTLKSQEQHEFPVSYFVAPEQLTKKATTRGTDLWQCGVILYFLLTGHMPFEGKTEKQLTQQILKCVPIPSNNFHNASKEGRELCLKFLEFVPTVRISARRALKHPWFKMKNSAPTNNVNQAGSLTNMRHFKANYRLQEQVLFFMIQKDSNNREIQRVRDLFTQLDKDGSGQLDKQELIQGLATLNIPQYQVESEIDSILQRIDSNHTGRIDYSEFIMASIDKKEIITKKSIQDVFKTIDRDNSGKISLKELKQIFKQTSISDQEWSSVMAEIDLNCDGSLSLVEFQEMMLLLLK